MDTQGKEKRIQEEAGPGTAHTSRPQRSHLGIRKEKGGIEKDNGECVYKCDCSHECNFLGGKELSDRHFVNLPRVPRTAMRLIDHIRGKLQMQGDSGILGLSCHISLPVTVTQNPCHIQSVTRPLKACPMTTNIPIPPLMFLACGH